MMNEPSWEDEEAPVAQQYMQQEQYEEQVVQFEEHVEQEVSHFDDESGNESFEEYSLAIF